MRTVAPKAVNTWLREAMCLGDKQTPFPWQKELFARFSRGEIECSLDIPTGLGKTAVMALWLIARACGVALPRRLVYVVDRRAVVDQATAEAVRLRRYVDGQPELKRALGLKHSLPISTLRGQYIDNREWLEDPSSPAIIVGTVDMIGSRLLFEGYRTTRKMRPYHAGLLGVDTLLVLDEAHLVPPFEKLIEAIAHGGAEFGPRDDALRQLIPPLRLLSLSATGRESAGQSFGLQDADLDDDVVKQRLWATKRLILHSLDGRSKLADALAQQAWRLAGEGTRAIRCIVFCNKRDDAVAAEKAIKKLAARDKEREPPDTELFVGSRRVFEREETANWLCEHGFIAGSEVTLTRSAFVFATSAGEVGVDLDADHMVSDLVAWERMVQRLGRVNRRGHGEADVIVVVDPQSETAAKAALNKTPNERTRKESEAVVICHAAMALDRLPRKDGAVDVSPGALRALKLGAEADPELAAILDAATTPAPLRPALSRALVDAWSMTSLKEHTGRPEIDPWLRGWVKDDPPQTAVVWRTYLPVRTEIDATQNEIEGLADQGTPRLSRPGRHRRTKGESEVDDFFEAAPPERDLGDGDVPRGKVANCSRDGGSRQAVERCGALRG